LVPLSVSFIALSWFPFLCSWLSFWSLRAATDDLLDDLLPLLGPWTALGVEGEFPFLTTTEQKD
jgi:hypothetical protein